ncbi:hypothetical protein Mapa_002276 [Marchantia paleacea]|nr:hypothetical protein Mapa_002276 [Marchantia paleacea]
MVGCHEQEAPTETTASSSSIERELVTGSSCVIDADANYSEMAVSDTAAGLTAPTARQRVSDEGKKPGPSSQHRPSPDRNYSQAVSENLQAVTSSSSEHRGINRIVQQPGQPLHRRHTTGATAPAMGTAEAAAAASSSSAEEAALDVDCVEGHDEGLHSGREIPRCGLENLDSSPDCGRRDASQGNSRHTCKVCLRQFSSGRALGGHMRAHGNGDPGTSSNADWKADKQLISSSPPAQASQHASNGAAENGIEHPGPDGVGRPQSLSPESRARARTREIQGRRAVGARRSKTNGKRRGSTTPKSSVEDAAALNKQQQHDEDDNAASRRQAERSSTSCSDNNSDGAHDDGAATDDAAGNVCDVCREEFENEKQLNTHKKSHEVYALRSNPKRSRRFIDQDYTEVAPSTIPAKKPTASQDKQQTEMPCPYPTCTKRFHSSKALFGHMRCHPDRTWRGIHPPDENGASTSAAGERQHRRKKSRPNSQVAVRVVSDSESEPEQKQSGKSGSTEHESDTDSIEAAYIQGQEANTNGDRQQSSTPGWWASGVTGKRSKRSRQTVRSLQAVQHGASTSNAPPDNALEELNETAMVMMMLASNPSGAPKQDDVDPDELREGKELSLKPNSADECPKDEPAEEAAAALPAKEEEEDEDEEEEGEDGEEKQGAAAAAVAVVEDLEQGPELVPKDEPMADAPDTEVPMEVDEEPEASLSEDGVQGEEAVQLEAGQQEASSSKHGQALGGHKRCHFDPTKKDAEKEGSSSNNGGKNPRSSNPAGRASSSQSRGRNESSDARGHSPRARSDPGLQQQATAAAAPAESRSTGGERSHSAQVFRPAIEIDLNKPPTVTYDEDEEMTPTPASAEESPVENHEAQASASAEASSSRDDGELVRNQQREYQLAIMHLTQRAPQGHTAAHPISGLNLEEQLHAYYKRVTPA